MKNVWLNTTPEGVSTFHRQINIIMNSILNRLDCNSPIAPYSKDKLLALLSNTQHVPLKGTDFLKVIQSKLEPLLTHMIDVNHPFCAAHLHCPTLLTGISAELLISALNLSMDSWDQSGIATLIEQQVIAWLANLLNYPLNSDGVFTSGGTQSNLMGILLAREAYAKRNGLKPFTQTGLYQSKYALTILCTPRAHFSVNQAARWLGMGSDNVVVVNNLHSKKLFNDLEKNNQRAFVFAATAGCTDFGLIDPLIKIREICDKHNLWLHVDAAVGGALLLTKQKKRLAGIEQADSVTIDFHKLFFQPISASTFVIKDKENFEFLNFYSDYLNRQSDELQGTINLVGKSLQTTRRFDALKVWLTWQHLGLTTIRQGIENLLVLTKVAAQIIKTRAELELANSPSINTVVFRYIDKLSSNQNAINHAIRQNLFNKGLAIIGETLFQDKTYLKLTLMNPTIAKEDMQQLIQMIIDQGNEIIAADVHSLSEVAVC